MGVLVEKLTKSFANTEVLKGISLEIPEESVTTIIGPSGSGKSTFLRCLNFLETPDSGYITFGNEKFDLKNITKTDIKKIQSYSAMVFQHYNLFKNKTALENVTEGLIIGKNVDKVEAESKGRDLLDRVGLSHRYDNYPVTLSGGEQQRVGIARALAVNPELLLFDEPTSALDPEKVGEVLDVIREVVKTSSATIIIVTHEMDFAKEISDQVYFMDQGQVVEHGSPEEIFGSPQEIRTQEFLKNIR